MIFGSCFVGLNSDLRILSSAVPDVILQRGGGGGGSVLNEVCLEAFNKSKQLLLWKKSHTAD